MADVMELRKRYKQTEAGMIPIDWEVKELSDLVSKFVNGGTPSTQITENWNGIIPWITGADILNQKVSVIRRYISKEAVKNSATNIIEKGNILLVSRTGVGKLAITPFDIAISQDFTGIYVKNDVLDTIYLFKYFDFIQNKLKTHNQGTSIQGITRETLSSVKIPLPPTKAEQTAIATVLTDADALITQLEKLIAKKRDIKQGVMQELLKPKEGWEVKNLKEVVAINMGQSPDSKHYNLNNEGIPLIQGNADIQNRKSIRRVWTKKITKACKTGDIIMTVRAPVGTIGIAQEDSCIGRGVCSFKATRINKHFLYHLLIFKETDWIMLEQGSTFTSANSKQIADLKLILPEDEITQSRIARIFSDMDAEIEALEKKLEKYKKIKQGMMQALLTGRIRLI